MTASGSGSTVDIANYLVAVWVERTSPPLNYTAVADAFNCDSQYLAIASVEWDTDDIECRGSIDRKWWSNDFFFAFFIYKFHFQKR